MAEKQKWGVLTASLALGLGACANTQERYLDAPPNTITISTYIGTKPTAPEAFASDKETATTTSIGLTAINGAVGTPPSVMVSAPEVHHSPVATESTTDPANETSTTAATIPVSTPQITEPLPPEDIFESTTPVVEATLVLTTTPDLTTTIVGIEAIIDTAPSSFGVIDPSITAQNGQPCMTRFSVTTLPDQILEFTPQITGTEFAIGMEDSFVSTEPYALHLGQADIVTVDPIDTGSRLAAAESVVTTTTDACSEYKNAIDGGELAQP